MAQVESHLLKIRFVGRLGDIDRVVKALQSQFTVAEASQYYPSRDNPNEARRYVTVVVTEQAK